ncbi:hypothetical protein AAG747_02385 [Rapidithrix thailandica]|uniref:Tetratricopeptide repeat protein n=1 Tax=Rapidithrix thailandica TaxID=413964 RepID=A0AAW9S5T3_9BACT
MKRKAILFLFLLSMFNLSYAQDEVAANNNQDNKNCDENGWCWGPDPTKSKEQYVLFSDSYKMNSLDQAITPCSWLLSNTPYLHKNLYIKATQLYNKLLSKATKEKNTAKITEYQDKILELLDKRVEHFGEEEYVIQRKGLRYYNYMKDRKEFNEAEALKLYEKIYELNKDETENSNITIMMVLAVGLRAKAYAIEATIDNYRSKAKDAEDEGNQPLADAYMKKIDEYKEKDKYKEYQELYEQYSEDWILTLYENVSGTIEHNIENEEQKSKANWEKTQSLVNSLISKVVNIDCDFVREKMGEDLKNNPDDINLAKRALKFMLTGKCTDDPLFLIAAQNIFETEPKGGLASTIANKHKASEDYDTAIEWLGKAIELYQEEPEKQAEVNLDIAKIKQVQRKYAEARQYALKAIEIDPNQGKEAYTLIGDLYMSSGSHCKGDNPVKSRACYMKAYDMYSQAGNSSKMSRAQAQFPSMEEIFTHNYEVGQSINVGCWIGGSTTVRKRP